MLSIQIDNLIVIQRGAKSRNYEENILTLFSTANDSLITIPITARDCRYHVLPRTLRPFSMIQQPLLVKLPKPFHQ